MVGREGIEPTRVVRHEIYSLALLLTGLPSHIEVVLPTSIYLLQFQVLYGL